jgi:nicotinamidase-related amidase
MPSTAAEALIVVDVQHAFVAEAGAVPGHRLLLRAVQKLIERARAAGVPIVFLQNDGSAGAVDEPQQPGWALFFEPVAADVVLRKSSDDGFDGTALYEWLQASRVRTLAVCGLLSEMCVAATVRAALAHGFGVVLPHDGHATYDVPPGPGGSPFVPANLAARAAEWSLGDDVEIVPSVADVCFRLRDDRTPLKRMA